MTKAPPVLEPPATGSSPRFVIWLIAERIVRGVVSTIVLALVARHLEPSGFGALNLAFATVGLAMPLAQLGIEGIVIGAIIRQPAAAGTILGTAAVLRLLTGGICAALVIAVSAIRPELAPARSAIAPAALLLLIQAPEVCDLWFRRFVQARPAAVARTAAIVGGALVKLGLVALGAGMPAFAWVQAGEAAAFAGALLLTYMRGPATGPRWGWSSLMARDLVRQGWGFMLAAFVGGVAFRVDQFAVARWSGEAATGLYFTAVRLVELPFFVAGAAAVSLYPVLASAADDAGRWQVELQRCFSMISTLAWLTALGATFAGPYVVPWLLGREYAAAVPVLTLHAWAALPLFTGLVRAQMLAVQPAPGTHAAVAVVTLVCQLVLNAILVPEHGIMGAAAAFLITQLAAAWLMPAILPALRPCLAPQARALLDPWRPSFWRQWKAPGAAGDSSA